MYNSKKGGDDMFKEELRKALQEAGLTQTDLANMLQIPLRTVQNWCGGKNTPAPYTQKIVLNSIAEYGREK